MKLSDEKMYSNVRKSRDVIFTSIVLFLISIAMFLLREIYWPLYKEQLNLIGIVTIFLSASIFIYYYLQMRPFNYVTSEYNESRRLSECKLSLSKIYEIEECLVQIEKLKVANQSTSHLKDIIVERYTSLPYRLTTFDFHDLDKNFLDKDGCVEIFKVNLTNIKNELNALIEQMDTKLLEYKSEKQQSYEKAIVTGERVFERLSREIDQLTKRANIYIIIGTVITSIAGVVLYYTVRDIISIYATSSKTSDGGGIFHSNDVMPLIARLTLIVFIEVFAFYYLRLHKDSMNSVRYYQNEITNVEMKMVGLNAAYCSHNNENIDTVITELSKTERNFLLTKSQSTIEVEKAKHDKGKLKEVAESISKLIKSAKA